ncbi:MAG: 2-oxoacid:acceptor oxidoreductase family protein [Bacteroidetes bacterium]|jgi:2-oxoglutarate ferredoxin oxidoreductase subunit gamma|nr:2-oxoacid:acceptor oxidoreductase family protein [Bacteroidota bacterium]
MARTEIKIGGFGGQGVILSGYIIGRAASIFDSKHATMIQAFGPEARGSACSAQVIVSNEPVAYPYITTPSLMVVMSQEAYTKFSPELAEGGTLITEEELVNPTNLRKDLKHYSIPATRIAEELGKKMVLNIVMMGFFTAMTGAVGREAMEEAVKVSVPKGTEELNLNAFKRGYEYGLSLQKK